MHDYNEIIQLGLSAFYSCVIHCVLQSNGNNVSKLIDRNRFNILRLAKLLICLINFVCWKTSFISMLLKIIE